MAANAARLKPKSVGWQIIAKQTKAPQTRILSASGSVIRPNLLPTLNFRAILPSTISVNSAMTNKTKAMSRKNGLFVADAEYRIMPRKTKVKANRVKVRMFGMNLTIRKSLLLFQM